MNDKMRMMWENANIRYTNDYLIPQVPYENRKSVPELFSEMIVRECLSIMENCDGDLDFAIYKTKKDFEV